MSLSFFSLAGLTVFFASCGTTGGRAITLEVAYQGTSTATAARTTSAGWTVSLDEAFMSLGPAYAYSPEGVASRLEHALVPVARAHGGHDALGGRTVRAEWLDAVLVDALDDALQARVRVAGSAGEVEEVAVLITAPTGDAAAATGDLHGHPAWVRGTARRGDVSIDFEGGLVLPEVSGVVEHRVAGIPLTEPLDEGGTLVLSVSPVGWLDAVDFAQLAEPATPGARRVIGASGQAQNAWLLGARTTSAFGAHWIAPTPNR